MKALIILILVGICSLSSAETFPSFNSQKEYLKAKLNYLEMFYNEYSASADDSAEVKALVKELFFSLHKSGLYRIDVVDDRFTVEESEQKRVLALWKNIRNQNKINPFVCSLLYDCANSYKLNVPTRPLEKLLEATFKSFYSKSGNDLQKMYFSISFLNYKIQTYRFRKLKENEVNDLRLIIDASVVTANKIVKETPAYIRFVYEYFSSELMKSGIYTHEVDYLYTQFIKDANTHTWLQLMMKAAQKSQRYKDDKNGPNAKKFSMESNQFYKDAAELHPENPEPFAFLISREYKDRKLYFEKARKAQFDYPDAYEVYAGTKPSYEFCMECFNTKRFDTNIPMALHKYLMSNKEMIKENENYSKLSFLYSSMAEKVGDEGIDSVFAYELYSERRRDKRNFISLKLALAVYCNEFDDIKSILKELKNKHLEIDAHAFSEFDLNTEIAVPYSYALSGNAGKLVSEINAKVSKISLNDSKLKFLKQDLEDARSMTNVKEADPFFDYCLAKIKNIEGYELGEWVNLYFTKDLNDYRQFGSWVYESSNSVKFTTAGWRKYLMFKKPELFKIPYEIEVDYEEIAVNGNGGTFRCGILLGNYKGMMSYSLFGKQEAGPEESICFWVNPRKKNASIKIPHARYGSQVQIERHPKWEQNNEVLKPVIAAISKNPKHKIKVKAWYHYFEFYVDDKLICKVHDKNFTPEMFGIGTDNDTIAYAGTGRFSNLKIRKISDTKPSK